MADIRVKELVDTYLADGRTMQLATAVDDVPWICTVYYVFYDQCLYWLSWPERRHSREVAKNSRAAATVVVKQDLPVVGLQMEGIVAEVSDGTEVKAVMEIYTAKYGSGAKFYEAFIAGENRHHMYRLAPMKAILFDELHFPKESQISIEWR